MTFVTLGFAGINLILDPKVSGTGNIQFLASNEKELALELTNFSGSLKLTASRQHQQQQNQQLKTTQHQSQVGVDSEPSAAISVTPPKNSESQNEAQAKSSGKPAKVRVKRHDEDDDDSHTQQASRDETANSRRSKREVRTSSNTEEAPSQKDTSEILKKELGRNEYNNPRTSETESLRSKSSVETDDSQTQLVDEDRVTKTNIRAAKRPSSPPAEQDMATQPTKRFRKGKGKVGDDCTLRSRSEKRGERKSEKRPLGHAEFGGKKVEGKTIDDDGDIGKRPSSMKRARGEEKQDTGAKQKTHTKKATFAKPIESSAPDPSSQEESQELIDGTRNSATETKEGNEEADLSLSMSDTLTPADSLTPEQSQELILGRLPEEAVAPTPSYSGPRGRWGHTMTMIGNRQALVYGGMGIEEGDGVLLKDVFVYDFTSREWTKPVNCDGKERQWHSAAYLPERQLLVSFGGEMVCPKKCTTKVTNEVRVFDTELSFWYTPECTGNLPAARSGHSATIVPKSQEMIVFGGIRNNRWTNSVSVLDTTKWIWSSPKIKGDAPRPKSYHSATWVPTVIDAATKSSGRLVIFGGNDSRQSFNSVHFLERTKIGKKDSWVWVHPAVSGDVPEERTGHSATLLSDQKTILIYGGWDPDEDDEKTDSVMEESYFLDTQTWVFTKCTKSGQARFICGSEDFGPKRAGHTAVLANDEVVLFGGRNSECDNFFVCDDLRVISTK